jgi:hypothetical protein
MACTRGAQKRFSLTAHYFLKCHTPAAVPPVTWLMVKSCSPFRMLLKKHASNWYIACPSGECARDNRPDSQRIALLNPLRKDHLAIFNPVPSPIRSSDHRTCMRLLNEVFHGSIQVEAEKELIQRQDEVHWPFSAA